MVIAGMGHHHRHWSSELRQALDSLRRAEQRVSSSVVATQVNLSSAVHAKYHVLVCNARPLQKIG